jgi:hypothetical protein
METIEREEMAAAESEDVGTFLEYMDGVLRRQENFLATIVANRDVGKQILFSLAAIAGLSLVHGVIMGSSSGMLQMLSSGVKVPVLYLLTLMICFPVLYVVNVVMGSQLGFLQTFALIVQALALNAIILASCSPIALFFTFTGARYDFLKLLHVAIFGFSGLWGMFALWRGLQAMCETSTVYPKQAVKILQVWVLVFAFVGTQMAWTLRPFVGSPGMEFQIFREPQQGNFYEAVWQSIFRLMNG